MERIASYLSHYLTEQGIVDEDDYEIYKYGVQTGLEMILCMAISILIAIHLGLLKEYIVFIIIFFPFRAYVGGIHMRQYWACLVCSCIVSSIVLLCSEYFKPSGYISFFITSIALMSIYRLAKAATAEWVSDLAEMIYFAKQRRRIIISAAILNFILLILDYTKILSILMYTMIVIISSMMLEVLKYKLKSERDNK